MPAILPVPHLRRGNADVPAPGQHGIEGETTTHKWKGDPRIGQARKRSGQDKCQEWGMGKMRTQEVARPHWPARKARAGQERAVRQSSRRVGRTLKGKRRQEGKGGARSERQPVARCGGRGGRAECKGM